MIEAQDISIGIDFGTTNTVIAFAGPDGEAEALQFTHDGVVHRTYQSALCFWEEHQGESASPRHGRRPWAVEQFVEGTAAHRFIQSFKTFAASSAFVQTRIFRQNFRFEDLLAAFLRSSLRHADTALSFATPSDRDRPARALRRRQSRRRPGDAALPRRLRPARRRPRPLCL